MRTGTCTLVIVALTLAVCMEVGGIEYGVKWTFEPFIVTTEGAAVTPDPELVENRIGAFPVAVAFEDDRFITIEMSDGTTTEGIFYEWVAVPKYNSAFKWFELQFIGQDRQETALNFFAHEDDLLLFLDTRPSQVPAPDTRLFLTVNIEGAHLRPLLQVEPVVDPGK